MKILIKNIIFLLFTATTLCQAQEKSKSTFDKLDAIYIYFDANSKDCEYSDARNKLGFKYQYIPDLLKENYIEYITAIGKGFKLNKAKRELVISKKEANKIVDERLNKIINDKVNDHLQDVFLNDYFKNIYVYDVSKKLAYPVSWMFIGYPPPIKECVLYYTYRKG